MLLKQLLTLIRLVVDNETVNSLIEIISKSLNTISKWVLSYILQYTEGLTKYVFTDYSRLSEIELPVLFRY